MNGIIAVMALTAMVSCVIAFGVSQLHIVLQKPQPIIQQEILQPWDFDEKYYLKTYPDAAEAVKGYQFASAYEHYRLQGAFKGYNPNAQFNEKFYLALYPDASNQVRDGYVLSGFDHYRRFGAKEGRLPKESDDIPPTPVKSYDEAVQAAAVNHIDLVEGSVAMRTEDVEKAVNQFNRLPESARQIIVKSNRSIHLVGGKQILEDPNVVKYMSNHLDVVNYDNAGDSRHHSSQIEGMTYGYGVKGTCFVDVVVTVTRLREDEPGGVMLHELGHFLDRCGSNLDEQAFSESDKFKSVWAQSELQSRFTDPYFTNTERGPAEMFAEAIALYYDSPESRASLPVAMREYIEQEVIPAWKERAGESVASH